MQSRIDIEVDNDWISTHLGDPGVRLLEIDVSGKAYAEGHIPGAVLWNAYSDLRDPDYKPVGRSELAALLSKSGINPDTTVVVYGYSAPLGLWLLKAHAHGDVPILAGNRNRWGDAGGVWSSELPEPARTSYAVPDLDARVFASRQDVYADIRDPECLILDVRSPAEYAGERFWPSGATEDAGRAGHVPGALNVPIDTLRRDDESLKDAGDLRTVFESAGVRDDKSVIAYCTIGNRASQAWFALHHLLGHPRVRVYYGSWIEWGKLRDTPIE